MAEEQLEKSELYHNDVYIGDKFYEQRGGRRILVISVYENYQHIFEETAKFFGSRLSLRVKPDPTKP